MHQAVDGVSEALIAFSVRKLHGLAWQTTRNSNLETVLVATIPKSDPELYTNCLRRLGLPTLMPISADGERIATIPKSALERLHKLGLDAASHALGVEPEFNDNRQRGFGR